jgi:hypothetical protein
MRFVTTVLKPKKNDSSILDQYRFIFTHREIRNFTYIKLNVIMRFNMYRINPSLGLEFQKYNIFKHKFYSHLLEKSDVDMNHWDYSQKCEIFTNM